jgi:hypothetical protein
LFSSRVNNTSHQVTQSMGKGIKSSSFSASMLMQHTVPISSDFQRCGYLHLNRDSLSLEKEKFYLIDADYPLEGSIEVFFLVYNIILPVSSEISLLTYKRACITLLFFTRCTLITLLGRSQLESLGQILIMILELVALLLAVLAVQFRNI